MDDADEAVVEQRHRDVAMWLVDGMAWAEAFARFEATLRPLIVAEERERCAAIAETLDLQTSDAFASIYGHANDIAAAIREQADV